MFVSLVKAPKMDDSEHLRKDWHKTFASIKPIWLDGLYFEIYIMPKTGPSK